MRSFSKVTLVRNPDVLPSNFHLRRCHVCSALNMHPILVNQCENCAKKLAPFYYYEEGAVDVKAEAKRPHYHPSNPTEYGPLIGVSVLWME